MGFGFNLILVFCVLPLTLLLLTLKIIFKKPILEGLLMLWAAILLITMFSWALRWFFEKPLLAKEDYYGSYVIDRDYFKGPNADWQYNHYRFEINENDSIYFYETINERIVKTYAGTIATTRSYSSARLILHFPELRSHILAENPTTYRNRLHFHLLFYSSKFNNVCFKKGKWEPIE